MSVWMHHVKVFSSVVLNFFTGVPLCLRIRRCFCRPVRKASSALRRWSLRCSCHPAYFAGPTFGSIWEETLLKVKIAFKVQQRQNTSRRCFLKTSKVLFAQLWKLISVHFSVVHVTILSPQKKTYWN